MKLKNLALLPLIVVGLNATTATNENVTPVYVVDFNRAADAAGLKYWVETSKLQLEEISQSFFDQDETKTKYPDTLTNADFVNTIYKNAFNRDGDPDGIIYWTKELESGRITRGNMILAVINGAKNTDEHGNDKTTIDNKTEVSLHFSATGSDDVSSATSVMDGITDDPTTVANAKEEIDQAVDDKNSTTGKIYPMTYKIDTVVGTSGDDKISGLVDFDANITGSSTNRSTYNVGDKIDGGAGNDTLTLTLGDVNATVDPIVPMTNVESIIFKDGNKSMSSVSISSKNWTGVENYTFDKNETNITEVRTSIKSLNFTGSNDSNITVNMLDIDTTTNHTGTSIAINASKATTDANITVKVGQKLIGDDDVIKTYTVNVKDNKKDTTLNLNSSVATTITISGNSDVNLTATSTKLTSVDASGLVKKTFNFESNSTAGVTIKGGSGDDNISVGAGSNNVVAGGAGVDVIDINNTRSVMDTIQVDGKADIVDINSSKIVDVVTGFIAGTDKINIVGLPTGSASNFIDGNGTVDGDANEVIEMADSVLSTGIVYANVQSNTNAYLAFDIDNDGKTDGMIKFIGKEDANLTYSDIK